jgi:hypothetical protein
MSVNVRANLPTLIFGLLRIRCRRVCAEAQEDNASTNRKTE